MKNLKALLLGVLTTCLFVISCNEDEPQIKITNFSFDTADIEVIEGYSVDLNDYLTIEGDDADKAEVSFSSNNDEVVSLSGTMLSAVGVGEATIEATETNTNKTATINVTVIADNIAVTGVALDEKTITLEIGSTKQLTATLTPEDATIKELTWTVSFPSEGKILEDDPTTIATVNDEGLVSAISPGNVVVTVTTKDGEFTASTEVEITGIKVTSIALDIENATLEVDEELQLPAIISPDDATESGVIWSVDFATGGRLNEDDPSSIASVSEDGLVTAIAIGDVVVTATSIDGSFNASADISVIPTPVTGIELDASSLSINIGETGYLAAIISPENATNQTVTWSLTEDDGNPETYATIDTETGEVTGISECDACGLAIVATTDDGEFSALADLFIVYVPVTSITLSPSSFSVDVGGTQQMTPTILPSNASNKNVTWSIDFGFGLCDAVPTDYATVSATGLVTGIAPDICDLMVIATAENETSVSGSASITVNPILATSIVIVDSDGNTFPDKEFISGPSDCSLSMLLESIITPENVSDESVTWSIDDEETATISSSGLLNFISTGTVRVTVTADDGSGVSDYLDVTFEGCI